MRIFCVALLGLFLVGCQTTSNVPLAVQDEVKKRFVLSCSVNYSDQYFRYEERIKDKITYYSIVYGEGGWIRVNASAGGARDNFYYNVVTDETICGWRRWTLTRRDFKASNNFLKDVSTRPIAVQWEGYEDLAAGNILLNQKVRTGFFYLVLPNNEGTCRGKYQMIGQADGTWSVYCTNKMEAQGTFTAYGPGKGSSGEGEDTQGRKVKFTIGAAS